MSERLPRTNLVPHLDDEANDVANNCRREVQQRHDQTHEGALQELRRRNQKARREKEEAVRRYREGKDRVPIGMTTYFHQQEWLGSKPSGRRRLVPREHMTKGGKHKLEMDDVARGRRHFSHEAHRTREQEQEEEKEELRNEQKMGRVARQPAPWNREDSMEKQRAKQARFKTHSRDNWFGVKLWADGDPLEDQADAALARTGMKAVRGVHKRDPSKLASSPPKRGRIHYRIQQDGAFRVASGEKTAKNEMSWKGKQQDRGRPLTARSSYLLAANGGNGGESMVKHPLFGGGRKKAPAGSMTTRVGGLLLQPEGMREPYRRARR